MAGEYRKLVKQRTATERKLQTAEEKSTELVNDLSELKLRHSSYSSGAATLKQVSDQISNCLTVTDPADWVKLINSSDRAVIFEPLNAWLDEDLLPEIIKPLMEKPAEEQETLESTESFEDEGILQRFRRCFAHVG